MVFLSHIHDTGHYYPFINALGLLTLVSRVLMRVYNMKIHFFPQRSQYISNLKKPACASKRDGLVLATL